MPGFLHVSPADLAMHVVLPELDGRVLAGAIMAEGGIANPQPAFRKECHVLRDTFRRGAVRLGGWLVQASPA